MTRNSSSCQRHLLRSKKAKPSPAAAAKMNTKCGWGEKLSQRATSLTKNIRLTEAC